MRYHVLAFLCAAAVIAYVQRLGFNVAERTVRGDLGLDREQIGRVMAAWSLGYALLQLPAGWLGDRFGSRRVLTTLAPAWSAWRGTSTASWASGSAWGWRRPASSPARRSRSGSGSANPAGPRRRACWAARWHWAPPSRLHSPD